METAQSIAGNLLMELLDSIKEEAKRRLETKTKDDGIFVSMIFVVGPESVEPLPFLFKNSAQKEVLVFLISELAKEMKAFGIIALMDSWTTLVPKGKSIDLNNVPLPSQSPDRKQALCITCTSSFFRKGYMLPYDNLDDKIVWGEEVEMADFEDANFGSLFPRKFDA